MLRQHLHRADAALNRWLAEAEHSLERAAEASIKGAFYCVVLAIYALVGLAVLVWAWRTVFY